MTDQYYCRKMQQLLRLQSKIDKFECTCRNTVGERCLKARNRLTKWQILKRTFLHKFNLKEV